MAITLDKLNQVESMIAAEFPKMTATEKAAISQIINQKRAMLYAQSKVNPKDIPTDPFQRGVFEQGLQGGSYKPAVDNTDVFANAGINPSNVPTNAAAQEVLAKQIKSGTYKPEPTKEEIAKQKLLQAGSASSNFIKELESQFQEAGGASFGGGPLARLQGFGAGLMGEIGINDAAKLYKDSKKGFIATIKSLSGDTGVMTEDDAARLLGLLPSLGSTPKEAKGKFDLLRSQLTAKYGGEKTNTTINPEYKGPTGNQAIDFLLGGAINTAKDIGAGITANMTEGVRNKSNEQADQTASQLETQAMQTQDMTQRKQLLQQANVIRQQVGKQASEVSKSFTPDINKSYAERALTSATEIASTAEIPAMLKSVLNIKNAKLFQGDKLMLQGRNEAAKAITKKASIEPILKAGRQAVLDDPAGTNFWKNVIEPGLKSQKEISIENLLDKTVKWNKAYTASGNVGKTAAAGVYDSITRAGKKILEKEAPEVTKFTQQLAKYYSRQKLVNKFAPAVIGGAGAGVGGFAIAKAVGQKK